MGMIRRIGIWRWTAMKVENLALRMDNGMLLCLASIYCAELYERNDNCVCWQMMFNLAGVLNTAEAVKDVAATITTWNREYHEGEQVSTFSAATVRTSFIYFSASCDMPKRRGTSGIFDNACM